MNLRQQLLGGATSYGPLLLSDSHIIAELVGSIGYGHVIIDHEHSPTNVASGQLMLQALRGSSASVPIVRLPAANDPVYMKKVLDSLQRCQEECWYPWSKMLPLLVPSYNPFDIPTTNNNNIALLEEVESAAARRPLSGPRVTERFPWRNTCESVRTNCSSWSRWSLH
jgi:hypothetical protein